MVAWKPNNLCNTCFVKFRSDRACCVRGSAIIVLEVHADVVAVFPPFLSSLGHPFCILFQYLFDFTDLLLHSRKFIR